MNAIRLVLLTVSSVIVDSAAQDVLGCGGFIKSHVPIDFSKVEVKLLTKGGILKDKISCAPNNGYYFVPLYDKGHYILELEPPPGWSFTPNRIELLVDGVSDLCSQGKDIDFIFKGFGITGKVESLGSNDGPVGIEVELKSSSDLRRTVTGSSGTFFFTPVYPGSYTVRVSNPRLKLWKDSVNVVVTEGNTELSAKSLVIQGYSVTGFVKNEGEPVKDTIVVLYSSDKKQSGPIQVDGCSREALVGLENMKPICSTKTDREGKFIFQTVPVGKYFVSPYYGVQNIYYKPTSIEFSVGHESVILVEYFEIIGFSIAGRVLKSEGGSAVADAAIYLNGKEVTRTKPDGSYNLEKLKAGTYSLKAQADGFLFKEEKLKITPNIKQMPDLVPISYRVCGRIMSDKSQTVTFSQVGSTKLVTSVSDSRTGQFCEYLSSGKYQIQVAVSNEDSQIGLLFFPKVDTIEVSSDVIEGITFSQLKAIVTGKVHCIQDKDCKGLRVVMKPSGESMGKSDIVIDVNGNSFKAVDVSPGSYDVKLMDNKFCWKASQQVVNVNNVNVEVPTFIQSGYSLVIVSSHNTQLNYKLLGQAKLEAIDVKKGRIVHCLEKPGMYNFTINSCHVYEEDTISFSTESDRNEIFLNAVQHTTTLTFKSDGDHGAVTATVNIDGNKREVGPLPFKNSGYELELLLSPMDKAVVVPHSESLYFDPPILSINGGTDCEHLGAKFKAFLGIVFKGKVIPPMAGVVVTVETQNTDSLIAETDANGVYKFPPLDKSKTYKISAKKESHVLVGPNEQGDFIAHKLAEIVIEVLDRTDKAPLQGTLLSLSGGEGYRRNLQTNENGKITFGSLSPGEYFLRPMMKEYIFEPTSKIITVKEGESVNIQLTGKRVAYSAYGQVTSLNGEPEENIIIMASGVGNCSHFSEEASSESTGLFRIRGLQPYCSYIIKVKTSADHYHIERSVPSAIEANSVTQDLTDLQFIVFRPLISMDILVKVFAKNPEHYKSLRLKIAREKYTSNLVYNGRIDTSNFVINKDNNYGIVVHVPPIPIDGRNYVVLLESTQPSKFDPEPVTITANSSFKYVKFDYIVSRTVTEQDIKQTSIWTIIAVIIVMFSVYNLGRFTRVVQEQMMSYIVGFINKIMVKKHGISEHVIDNDDIDQIVQSINAVKRKPKPKRI